MGSFESAQSSGPVIPTPDQRIRVFVSSTLEELAPERNAARAAVETLRLTPVMFEVGARAHPPADLYRSYLDQSDVFVGIYWEEYGWVGPGMDISGVADELGRAGGKPRLLYVKEPGAGRDPRLEELLDSVMEEGSVTFRVFKDADELRELLLDDLAVLVTERFRGDGELSRQELSFMFVDLEDSTGLLRRLGDPYAELLATYHRMVTSVTERHAGHVSNVEGDGLFCVFNIAADGVGAAVDVQREMAASEWGRGEHPRCRIGVHCGTATRTFEGYVGLDVHVGARVGAAARGGQILLSSAAADLVEDLVDGSGWQLVDLGHYELKGVGESERLFRLDVPGLERVTSAPLARPRIPTALPATPHEIVGREADLRGAGEMLARDNVRLVTLTGPGGTGKTRLAIELTRRLGAMFPDGVVFVELAAVTEPDRFLPVVARALGVRESAERTLLDGLKSVIADSRMLLVLDNMEQLVDAASDVGKLLETMPEVRVLVTSRSPLRIGWEHEYPLSPLAVPEEGATPEKIEGSDSVVLFVERARAVRPDFTLGQGNEASVAEITRRLDGLPLAIELAAARLRSFTPETLLQRLGDGLTLLDRGSTDAPERHRTLRAAISWSHDLLDEEERVVFRRLGVFAGGWSLDAALFVCCDDQLSEGRVMDVLEDLVTKSLVVFSIDDEGRARYRLLETLREFSMERLTESGDETETRLRHLAWCRSIAEGIADVLATPQFPSFLDAIERDRFNLREAMAWSLESGKGTDDALLICGMLPLFFDTRGFVAEGVRWNRAVVALTASDGTTLPRAVALSSLGWLEMLAGEPGESDWALTTAVQMFRDLDEEEWLGRALAMQGMTTYNMDRFDDAEAQFNEAIELCRRFGLEWLDKAWCVYGLAHIALARGDFAKAGAMLRQAYEFSLGYGLTWGVGHTQLSLGVLAFMTGELDQAVDRITQSLLVRQQLRDARGICDCIGMMALLASVRGDHALSATLLGAAEVAREAFGHLPVPWLQPMLEQAETSARSNLGDDYGAHHDAGRDLSVDETVTVIVDRFTPAGETVSAAV